MRGIRTGAAGGAIFDPKVTRFNGIYKEALVISRRIEGVVRARLWIYPSFTDGLMLAVSR